MLASSSSSEILPKSWQVFINFRGAELRDNFISHLEGALTLAGINYYIDKKEVLSEDLNVLFERIKQSEIALSIFSIKYAESNWCLDELVEIMDQVKKEKLRFIPVFFNVKPEEVKDQKGEFGLKLYAEGKRKRPNIPKWEDALQSVPSKIGLELKNHRDEKELVDKIVDSIKRVLALIEKDKFSFQNQREGEKLRSSKIPLSATDDNDNGTTPPQYQVFISFRGDELGSSFVGFLRKAMRLRKFNLVYDDEFTMRGTTALQNDFTKIEDSRVAMVIFSKRYTESRWCLDELVKMKEQMEQGKLLVIPIFYRLKTSDCKRLEGPFGNYFRNLEWEYRSEPERIKKWKEALAFISDITGLTLHALSDDSRFVYSIIDEVKRVLNEMSLIESIERIEKELTRKPFTEEKEELETTSIFGVKPRSKQLEEKLDFDHDENHILGVVGMPGIGKTTLRSVEEHLNRMDSGAENVETCSLSSLEIPLSSMAVSVIDDDYRITPTKYQTIIPPPPVSRGGEHFSGFSTDISFVSSHGNISSRKIEQLKMPPPDYEMTKLFKPVEVDMDYYFNKTKTVGIVGMPRIGKTTPRSVAEHLNMMDSGAENVDSFSLSSLEIPPSSMAISAIDGDYGITPPHYQAIIPPLSKGGDRFIGLPTDISFVSSHGNISSRQVEKPVSPSDNYEMTKRFKKVEEVMDSYSNKTKTVGIVGKPRIGKTKTKTTPRSVAEHFNWMDSGAENVDSFSLSSLKIPLSSMAVSAIDGDYGITPPHYQAIIRPVSRGGEHFIGLSTDMSSVSSHGNISSGQIEQPQAPPPEYGMEKRLKQLEEKIDFYCDETKIVGIVGMPGIGKTTLAEKFYRKWLPGVTTMFFRSMFLTDVNHMSCENGLDWLQTRLIQDLLMDIHPSIRFIKNGLKFWKDDLLRKRVFIVLDDVTCKKQIKSLFGKRDWIKKGSKIVITSSDESVLKELVDDTYVVLRLNDKDSLQWFTNHAFGLDHAEGNFIKLSRHFLKYAKGNPLALKAFGVELRGKDEAYWEQRIRTLTQSSNKSIQNVLRRRYGELTERQQDAFLDVACFFKSENASYVRCLVNSFDSGSTEVWDEIRDLKDKFLVNISGGRIEMHDMLCTFAKVLASPSRTLSKYARFQHRLWNFQDIICVLDYEEKHKWEMNFVRGIFLDMSEVPEGMIFDANIFSSMGNLLYLRIYNSVCPKEDECVLKFDTSREFQLPLNELRYLHWLKYPLEKLPSDFNATKLVSLELPYSSIKQLWVGFKDTHKLKWVDLSYSCKLVNLSGLSNAQNLERLNLESCTSLLNLPQEMENMKSLVFLNMRRCKSLKILQRMKLRSLKVLILSDCSKLQEFEVISENLEALYLDGTALKRLPPATGDLKTLAILNMKGCTKLESLPKRLGKQKALEELILSGCSELESLPKDVENMKHLRILLLDGTRIKAMPKIYSLERLCLSRNIAMIHLQGNLGQFYQLKWLDLKDCKYLRHLPTLPPNLEYLDACGCERLETVMNPLAVFMMSQQIRSIFFFTKCNNLNQEAKESISSYAKWKCHRPAREYCDRGIGSGAMFNTCYPGFEVPSWFHHQTVGSVLESRLEPHWCNNRLSGIALCAVVSFHENQDPIIDSFSVKCTLEFENKDGSCICFDCDVGDLTEPGRIESDHVFIGYTSCSHITKRLEDHYSGNSIPTKACLKFYVSDACKGEIVNCGLSSVYAEPYNVHVAENHYITSFKKGGGWVEEANHYITSFKKSGGWVDENLFRYIFLAFLSVIFIFLAILLKLLKEEKTRDM